MFRTQSNVWKWKLRQILSLEFVIGQSEWTNRMNWCCNNWKFLSIIDEKKMEQSSEKVLIFHLFIFFTTNNIMYFDDCFIRDCAFVCIPSGHSTLSFPSCLWLVRQTSSWVCLLIVVVLCYYYFSVTAVSSSRLFSSSSSFLRLVCLSSFLSLSCARAVSLSPPESTSALCVCVCVVDQK